MKTALCFALAATGCTMVLDIPDRHLASDSTCTGKVQIKILYDATGATNDVSVPFFKGQTDLIREINSTGGIRGCTIDYEAVDYGYIPTGAQTAYDGWKAKSEWKDVAAILGWGSTDSILLAPQVREDRKPYLSASYFGGLAAPKATTRDESIPELDPSFIERDFPQHFQSDGFGYNFFAGTDYSTGARIGMFHVVSQGAKRVGFAFCSADYCKGPIPAARSYAKLLGLRLGRDLTVELTDNQTTYNQKVLAYFQQEKAQKVADPSYEMVDWVWGGNTTKTTAFLAKAIAAVNANAALGIPKVQIIVNNWGFDENLFTACGTDCVDIIHGIMPFVAYGDPRAGEMGKVTALHDKYRMIDAAKDGAVTFKNVRYVQGYVNVLLLKIGVDRVVTQGKPVTGDNIKEALEKLSGLDTGGLTGRLTYTPDDHRPQSTESIYKFNASGQLVLENVRTITMEDTWLGW